MSNQLQYLKTNQPPNPNPLCLSLVMDHIHQSLNHKCLKSNKPYPIGFVFLLFDQDKHQGLKECNALIGFAYDLCRFTADYNKFLDTRPLYLASLFRVFHPKSFTHDLVKRLEQTVTKTDVETVPTILQTFACQNLHTLIHEFNLSVHVISTQHRNSVFKTQHLTLPHTVRFHESSEMLKDIKPIGFIYALELTPSAFHNVYRYRKILKQQLNGPLNASVIPSDRDHVVYKVGYSVNFMHRLRSYPAKGVKVIQLIRTYNPRDKEAHITQHLAANPSDFKCIGHHREYYQCDPHTLLQSFHQVFLQSPDVDNHPLYLATPFTSCKVTYLNTFNHKLDENQISSNSINTKQYFLAKLIYALEIDNIVRDIHISDDEWKRLCNVYQVLQVFHAQKNNQNIPSYVSMISIFLLLSVCSA